MDVVSLVGINRIVLPFKYEFDGLSLNIRLPSVELLRTSELLNSLKLRVGLDMYLLGLKTKAMNYKTL